MVSADAGADLRAVARIFWPRRWGVLRSVLLVVPACGVIGAAATPRQVTATVFAEVIAPAKPVDAMAWLRTRAVTVTDQRDGALTLSVTGRDPATAQATVTAAVSSYVGAETRRMRSDQAVQAAQARRAWQVVHARLAVMPAVKGTSALGGAEFQADGSIRLRSVATEAAIRRMAVVFEEVTAARRMDETAASMTAPVPRALVLVTPVTVEVPSRLTHAAVAACGATAAMGLWWFGVIWWEIARVEHARGR